ncbi:MAG: hypothetical protein Q9222_000439 [Ikaeria aurantiellina]
MLGPLLVCAVFAGISNAISLTYKSQPRQLNTNFANNSAVATSGSGSITGVATFVDFAHEPNTLCGPLSGEKGTWGAAAGSISPGLGPGGQCFQSVDMGGISGDISGVGKSIVVQIIDACPAENAWNYCKTDQPDKRQKCMDRNTNSLDIEVNSYTELTGVAYASCLTTSEVEAAD